MSEHAHDDRAHDDKARAEASTETPPETPDETGSGTPGADTSQTTGRPEGQDASDIMTDLTHDTTNPPAGGTTGSAGSPADPTEVLPPAAVLAGTPTQVTPASATPPTQEIAQATHRIPEGTAPEGEVHPAYGIAAARVQAESGAVQDAPVHDESDPLAPLREPEPQGPGPQTGPVPVGGQPVLTGSAPTGAGPAGPGQAAPAHAGAAQTGQPGQPVAQPAVRRGPRVGTAVWGLIVIAIGLGILAVAAGVVFDLGVALIVLLGAAGVILVVGSVVSSVRRR
ncbi:hypothetical protein ACO229_18145 [Promicromonospora sp. MS192]|uniref:hypothetical protein n=1 Tax=Promicromonospora sp. MS192 TaxID=3412684 RepID=UPI003C2B7644